MRYIVLGIFTLAGISQASDESVICDANKLQLFPKIVKGSGGEAYILFADSRQSSGAWEVYLQKVNSSLTRQWGSDNQGLRISRTLNDSSDSPTPRWHGHRLSGEIVSSIAGSDTGVIAVWINHHSLKGGNYNPGIYARRVSSTGAVQWDSTIYISSATSAFSACSDGQGGVVCAWMEKSGGDYKIMAEKRNVSGDSIWAVPVRSDPNIAHSAKVMGSVSASGSIDGIWVGWIEKDASNENRLTLFVKKFDLNGDSLTGKVGLQAQTAASYFLGFVLTPDDSGGVWSAWEYVNKAKINDTLYQYQWSGIYARRVKSDGSCIPVSDKLEIAKDEQSTYDPDSINLRPPIITIDKNRGCIVNWIQRSNPSSSWQLRVQRVHHNGTIQSPWSNGGVAVSSTSVNQMIPDIFNDGGIGCIITWRNGDGNSADIWAQRIYEEGGQIKKWSNSGKQICGASNFQGSPRIVKSDTDHTIIVWNDNRSSWDIYARKIDISTGE